MVTRVMAMVDSKVTVDTEATATTITPEATTATAEDMTTVSTD